MSRRLSKKSRSKTLAGILALSAANLPKPDSQRLESLFACSIARRKNLRSSLLVGTALTAGVFTASVFGATMIDVSSAIAACSAKRHNRKLHRQLPHDGRHARV